MTASNAVAKSTPDGYTILMGTSTPLAILATLYKPALRSGDRFVPLALIATIPFVLVVNNDLPVHSVAELIAYAKAHPGELSYGSTGPGTPFHLNGELFSAMTGIEMVHVPYKAVVDAQVDLMGGRIQVMFTDFTSSVPLIKDGKMRALGVTTKTRAAAMPDLHRSPNSACRAMMPRRGRWWRHRRQRRGRSSTNCMTELETIMALPETRNAITRIGLVPAEATRSRNCRPSSAPKSCAGATIVKRSGASVD